MAVCRSCGVAPVFGRGVRFCDPCRRQKIDAKSPKIGACRICGTALRGNGSGACPFQSSRSHWPRVAEVDVNGSTLNQPASASSEPAFARSALRRPQVRRRKQVTFSEAALTKKKTVIGRAPLLAARDLERETHVPHDPNSITPLMAFMDGYYLGAAGGMMVPKSYRMNVVEEVGCQMMFG